MDPHPKQLEDLGIFGRQRDVALLTFNESSIESEIEIPGVEAEDSFEDLKCSHVAVRTDGDFDEGIKHVAATVSKATGSRNHQSYLVGNSFGVDGGAMAARICGMRGTSNDEV